MGVSTRRITQSTVQRTPQTEGVTMTDSTYIFEAENAVIRIWRDDKSFDLINSYTKGRN